MSRAFPMVAMCLLLVAGGLVACAGTPSKTVTVNRWAGTVCQIMRDYHDDLEGVRDAVDAAPNRSDAERALRVAVAGADRADQAIGKAGEPDMSNGKKIAELFKVGFHDALEVFRDALDEAGDLPADPRASRTAVGDLALKVDEGLEQVGDSFAGLDDLDKDGTLGKALSAQPACGGIL